MAKKVAKKKATKPRKPYVQRATVWKAVGGGLNYPGEKKVCKVGRHKVLVERHERLDYYGNPVHTVSVLNRDGTVKAHYTSNGGADFTAEGALKRAGIETKRKPLTKKTK